MDPRDQADEALARARERGAFVVTPDNATSPMDASSTVRIAREVIEDVDPESTMVITQSSPQSRSSEPEWPPEQHEQSNQATPEYMRSQYAPLPGGRASSWQPNGSGTVGTPAQQFPNTPY